MNNIVAQQTVSHEKLSQVKEKYETAWGSYLLDAEQVAREEGQNLSRILGRCLFLRGAGAQKKWRGYLPQMGGMDLSPRIPSAAQVAYYMSTVVELLRQHIPADTGRIVEMGSGWGAVISSFWLNGGPRDADYHALEYTENGRALTRLLAAAEPRFKLQSAAFDYYHADFTSLGAEAKKTTVYSTFSIEQITQVPDSLIERMLAIPGFERAIHIEPLGWQTRERSLGATFDRLLAACGIGPLTRNTATARRCRRQGFNANLIAVLRRFEQAGRIVIEEIDVDIVGHHPGNAGTLVRWRKA